MLRVKFRSQVDMGQGHALGTSYGVDCHEVNYDNGTLEMFNTVTGRKYVHRGITKFTVEEEIYANSVKT